MEYFKIIKDLNMKTKHIIWLIIFFPVGLWLMHKDGINVKLLIYIIIGGSIGYAIVGGGGSSFTEEKLEGHTYYLGDYHYVDFKEGNNYYIYQKTSKDVWLRTCGGSGSYSIEDGQVKLNSNDSNCESTRKKAKKYPKSTFSKSAYE
jgi:hypothetical protein